MTPLCRLLNPTAVFCNNRDIYYQMLAQADTGTTEGQEEWCIYVLQGILDELHKVNTPGNDSSSLLRKAQSWRPLAKLGTAKRGNLDLIGLD